MNVVYFSKFSKIKKNKTKEHEKYLIMVADEISNTLEEIPVNPRNLDSNAYEFIKFVNSLLSGSIIDEIEYDGTIEDYTDEIYKRCLSLLRAKANDEYEWGYVNDKPAKLYTLAYRDSDESFHETAVINARETILKVAKDFGLPELKKLAS